MSRTIPTIDRWTAVRDLVTSPAATAVLQDEIPEVMASGAATTFAGFPLGVFLAVAAPGDPDRVARLLERLAPLPHPSPRPEDAPAPVPSGDYEPASTAVGSATLTVPDAAAAGAPVELVIEGPAHGNPFLDVEVVAELTCDGQVLTIGGFYDGDGIYRIRFLPARSGAWDVVTRSNARSMDGLTARLEVAEGTVLGPVRTDGGFGFQRPDGTPFVPVGTTAYAWTHQPEELQDRTLTALTGGPFNKLRMGLFPKSFLYNTNEPDRFVFPRKPDGGFDLERFDLEYFRHLERRLAQLLDAGIEADLILFHPYDRWGFSELGRVADDRYVRYVVRRLAATPNVWWSMANEYELLLAKRPEDWDRLARIVAAEDHADHLLSIHNIVEPWDASSPWATHCSIQRSAPSLSEPVQEWRLRWGKPVLVDEMGYEGDLDQGWGSLTAEEVVLRFWQVTFAGGYATHGETFWSPDEEIFWAKGGDLVGESIARIGFLRQLVNASPTGRVDPLPSEFDAAWAGAAGQYVLISLGRGRPRFRDVPVPVGSRARIEVIDGWNMTIEQVEGEHQGIVRVQLPARPMTAIRLRLTPIETEVQP